MNIESMRMLSYCSFKVDDADLPVPARERLLAIRRFNELCAEVHPPALGRIRARGAVGDGPAAASGAAGGAGAGAGPAGGGGGQHRRAHGAFGVGAGDAALAVGSQRAGRTAGRGLRDDGAMRLYWASDALLANRDAIKDGCSSGRRGSADGDAVRPDEHVL